MTFHNRCAICEMSFTDWVAFNHHHRTAHNKHTAIVPTRTTNRTKEQIVLEWEYRNMGSLII